ncbi:Synapsin-like protein, partial [Leptotrombidium deliense]
SKYFRGKRLQGDFEIRVEQAEFREVNLYSNSEAGTTCTVTIHERGGSKSSRSFRPDFLLVRQHVKDVYDDHRDILLGLKYGGVPSINSIHSLYNFTDRPWVFSQLIGIQRRLGKENFPLIEQTFFPNYKEMVSSEAKSLLIRSQYKHNYA